MIWFLLVVAVASLAWLVLRQRGGKPGSAGPVVADLSILPERFVVFDIETTGLNPDRNKIIEIGAIRVNRDSNKHETFQALIKIKGTVPAKIIELTGITTDMLKAQGEPLETVLPQFLAFIGDLRLVSFNAPFDLGFLRQALRQQGLRLENPWSCALDMARRAWPGRESYRLSELAKDGGMASQEHRVLGDCRLALTVYAAAANRLRCIE